MKFKKKKTIWHQKRLKDSYFKEAKNINKTTVIYTQCDRFHEVEGYSWWDVPVAETSKMNSVNKAYKIYLKQKKDQRFYN